MSVPREFRRRIAEHNRHCWMAAALSLLGAWLAWTVGIVLYTGAILLFETVRTGDTNILRRPPWFYPVGGGLAAVLIIWAAADRRRKRYKPPSDRPIIGWHLLPEVLLLPARMTFGIWDHMGARVVLTRRECEDAWQLLQVLSEKGKLTSTALARDFADPQRAAQLLPALQLIGWIDLHRGEDDWFYLVRSDQEDLLRTLKAQPES